MKTKWDLKQLFPDGNIEEYTERKVRKWKAFASKYRKDKSFLKSPPKLKEALDEYCKLRIVYDTYGLDNFYYRLASDLKLDNSDLKQKEKKHYDISLNLANQLEFFSLELGKVSKDRQKEFLRSPLLSEYKYFLKRLFVVSKYFLLEESEKIMKLLSTSSYSNWVRMTDELLNTEKALVHNSNGKKEEISFSELTERINDPRKKIRKEAGKKFNEILEKYLKVAEYEINSILDEKRVSDNLRGYKYPEETNHIVNDVSTEMVGKLVEEVTKRNDLSHRYYELKAKLMGKKKLEYYERNVPLGSVSKRYSFTEASDIVGNVIKQVDSGFYQIYSTLLSNGQVDVFPEVGKKSGGYCVGNTISSPIFILLNYIGTYKNVTTLAHEMGHAINNELMRNIKNPLYYGISSITQEVSSNFFEDFVCDEVSKSLSKEEQLNVLMERLNSGVSSVHRQIACYKFERDLHREFRKKKFLSYEDIGALFSNKMKEYMGDFVDHPKYSHNWWLYWRHIRLYFYVYSYASGYLISWYMQRQVRKDKQWVKKLKKFMKAGSSDSPTNILKSIGIDIESGELWKEGLDEMEGMLEKAEKLAKELGKI